MVIRTSVFRGFPGTLHTDSRMIHYIRSKSLQYPSVVYGDSAIGFCKSVE
jgi:hypothetical protein